jgi:hypothetical protein
MAEADAGGIVDVEEVRVTRPSVGVQNRHCSGVSRAAAAKAIDLDLSTKD